MPRRDLQEKRLVRPVVLTFVQYYLPAYKAGGPVRTISNMVEHLGEQFDFLVVASDRDSRDPMPFEGVQVDAWNDVGGARVFYTSPAHRNIRAIAQLMRTVDYDVLYLNSFFSWQSTVVPLLARLLRLAPRRPVVLAPRGEFSEGALELKSTKKRAFLLLARLFGLYRDVVWQASSEYEEADIRNVFRSRALRVVIAPDLTPKSQPAGSSPAEAQPMEPLRLVFLSRISRKKNLDYGLKILSSVRTPVALTVYGSISDERYWAECREAIMGLPAHVSVSYGGVIHHDDVLDTLANHDLFLLPTKGENYGHVIIEAMSVGLPVLVSDQTPWRNLQDYGVGYDLPLDDMGAFCAAVEYQAALGMDARTAQRERVRGYARSVMEDQAVVGRNRELFEMALQGSRR